MGTGCTNVRKGRAHTDATRAALALRGPRVTYGDREGSQHCSGSSLSFPSPEIGEKGHAGDRQHLAHIRQAQNLCHKSTFFYILFTE